MGIKKDAPPSDRRVPAGPETTRMPVGADYRHEMPTYTDPVELEAARLRSKLNSTRPPGAPPPPGELTEEQRIAAYETRFGGFDRVPTVLVSAGELLGRNIDPRASMLLGLFDGRASIRTILDMGVLDRFDTLAGLSDLLERGIIALRDGR